MSENDPNKSPKESQPKEDTSKPSEQASQKVETPAPEPTPEPSSKFAWSQAFAILGTVTLVLIAFIAYIVIAQQREEERQAAIAAERQMIAELNEQLPEFLSFHANTLGKLVVMESQETLEFVKLPKTSGGWVLDDGIVQRLRVPVSYAYQLDSIEGWELDIDGNVARVIAPTVKTHLPPRIDMDKVSLADNQGWQKLSAEEAQSLTEPILPLLAERAQASFEAKREKIKQAARAKLESLILGWLLEEGKFKNPDFAAVKLVFAEPLTISEPSEKESEPTPDESKPEVSAPEPIEEKAKQSEKQPKEQPKATGQITATTPPIEAPTEVKQAEQEAQTPSANTPARAPAPVEESPEAEDADTEQAPTPAPAKDASKDKETESSDTSEGTEKTKLEIDHASPVITTPMAMSFTIRI